MTEPFGEGDIEPPPRDPMKQQQWDLGDDEQASEIDEYDTYIDDPPDKEMTIDEYGEGGETEISEWVDQEARPRDSRPPEDEQSGFHETDSP
ncbi:MAG: hypothetical protein GEV11_26130 [Streptosporangiales bacterium]|nr:hypothetical protein [Streptosporangiales bacterium]